MNKFFVKSIGYNVLGDELEMELCEYQGKVEFRQPYFERTWSTIEFNSEYDALVQLRKLCEPDRILTVLEDTGKIVSTHGFESGLTSMRICRMIS